MTAEEFVKEQYPKARVEKYEKGSGIAKQARSIYYLCWSSFGGDRLSEGDTKQRAWVNAKNNILSNE